jgi:hypothetical protein
MATVDRSVWELQTILRKLGAPLEVDRKYGPITERTWSLLTSRLGLSPHIRKKTDLVAEVDAATHAKLLNEYILRKSPKPGGANDFEKLNNAIVLMDRTLRDSDPAARQLAIDWQRIAGDPAWRSFVGALPPIWAYSLTGFWDRYFSVWSKLDSNTKSLLVHPAPIEPGGILSSNAWRDLWDPALDEALRLGKTLLQAAGAQLAKGAAEETRKQTYDWAWSLAGVALGGLGVYFLLRRPAGTRAA